MCIPHLCFRSKISYTFLISPMRATCLAHLTLLDLIALKYLVMTAEYEAPRAILSVLLLLPPS
jgi:hypothetical protein